MKNKSLGGVYHQFDVRTCTFKGPNGYDRRSNIVISLTALFAVRCKNSIDYDSKIIFGGDMNVIFDILLEADGGNPSLWQAVCSNIQKQVFNIQKLVLIFKN